MKHCRPLSVFAAIAACTSFALFAWIVLHSRYQDAVLVSALFAACVALTASLLTVSRARRRDGEHEMRGVIQGLENARGSLADTLHHSEHELKQVRAKLQAEVAQRERYERLAQQNFYLDPLTKLPNRSFLNVDLDKAVAAARRSSAQVAVMFLDLDNFKGVNESFGHGTGDELLKQAAGRLSACLRSEDTLVRLDEGQGGSVARIGGDEFVLLIRNAPNASCAARVGQRVIESFRAPFVVRGQKIQVGVSIGVASYPADGDGAEALIKNADAALYRAKAAGGNRVQTHSSAMSADAYWRQATTSHLRKAIEQDRLVLHYQPKVESGSHRLVGMEALLRLKTPDRGLIGAHEFITVAEETGLIVPIGEWVLMEVCRQLRAWQDMGLSLNHVAVNISSLQFGEDRLFSALMAALQRHRISPRLLELEVTENLLMKNTEATFATLQRIREMGATVALDDFGSGYSSLGSLKRLPVDAVKIDHSFVRALDADGGERAMTNAIVNLAHILGLKAIAEGVETQSQTKALLEMGCDQMQGYLFAPAVDAGSMTQLLREGSVPMHTLARLPTQKLQASVPSLGDGPFNGEATILNDELIDELRAAFAS